jgi:hypothetical protein
MHHQIDVPAKRGSPFRGLTVHPEDFRRQMKWLKSLEIGARDLAPNLIFSRLKNLSA